MTTGMEEELIVEDQDEISDLEQSRIMSLKRSERSSRGGVYPGNIH